MTYYQFADNIFLFFNHKKEGKQRKKQSAPGYLHTGSLFVSLRVVWIQCLYYHFESRSSENAFSFTGKYLSHETANNKTWKLCPNKDISQEILCLAEIFPPLCQFLSAQSRQLPQEVVYLEVLPNQDLGKYPTVFHTVPKYSTISSNRLSVSKQKHVTSISFL